MVKVRIIWNAYAGAPDGDFVDCEMPAAPKTGDGIMVRKPGEARAEEVKVRRIIWHVGAPAEPGALPRVARVDAEVYTGLMG